MTVLPPNRDSDDSRDGASVPHWYVYRDIPADDSSGPDSLGPESSGPDANTEEHVSAWLADAPPWRAPGSPWHERPDRVERTPPPFPQDGPARRRGARYITTNGARELDAINIALRLRRPLLIKGAPGLGKSSLAYSIAWRLGLGLPLRWEISSRTTLVDGLYRYDAVSHLQATRSADADQPPDIGEFITLGPLGTALLPTERPRVLLVDELDKASYDLPNDLLHAFEEGGFAIQELLRTGGQTRVLPYDHGAGTGDANSAGERVVVIGGRIQTHHHPVVIVTTNQERQFPDAFRRRCVELELQRPADPMVWARIVAGWFGESIGDSDTAKWDSLLDNYGEQNTDVLLQALFLQRQGAHTSAIKNTLKRGIEAQGDLMADKEGA